MTGHVERARAVARVLDSALRVPGTNIRFGLDAVLGLIPGLGDVTGAVMAGYLILLAAGLGVPAVVVARMLLNVGVDTLLGTIPLLGDVVDIGWKANTRNLALLERALEQPVATRESSMAVIVGAVAALGLLATAGVLLTILAVRLVLSALS